MSRPFFQRKLLSLAALTAYLTAAAPPAFAQQAAPTGPDAVYLKDNNVIRGTLSEIVVGDHVTVMLSTGQTARILWAFVARIDHNGQPVDTSAHAPPLTSPATAPPAPSGNVTVHIEGSEVTLEQLSGGSWVGVCSTPCDRPLPVGPSYRIVGDGVRNSRAFQLAGQNGDRVVLDVNTASKGGFAGGIVLISVGSPFILIGGLTLLIVAAVNGSGHQNTGNAATIGGIMLGGGVASLVIGLVLVTGNSSTKVDQSLGGPAPKAAWLSGLEMAKTEPARSPIFRDDTSTASLPKAPMVPIFSGSF
ncbi:hypothetical protein [Pendulispora albinea]|uniref:Uncharacterized protein n=1 Tax=Pendulispora albinea TaxID=2741071 RepID=A0ABZ2LQ33_9BACT